MVASGASIRARTSARGALGPPAAGIKIEFMSGGEGNVLVEVVNRFTDRVRELGPLGEAEGIDRRQLQLGLAAARKLVPYLKLVERERLRAMLARDLANARPMPLRDVMAETFGRLAELQADDGTDDGVDPGGSPAVGPLPEGPQA